MATDIYSFQAMFWGLCSLVPQVCVCARSEDRKRRTAPNYYAIGSWGWDEKVGSIGGGR